MQNISIERQRDIYKIHSSSPPLLLPLLVCSGSEYARSEILERHPPMPRKTSGGLVRPALCVSPTWRCSPNMLETKACSKAVRFDTRLERIKHFSQVDKPMTIRAACDREADSTFDESSSQSPLFEWAIVRPAEGTLRFFPLASAKRGFLSSDYKYCSCT
jgi:hypothetical protein